MEVTVKEVLDDYAKHGTSAKTGKDWAMSKVELSNGESAYIFNPIKVGDQVKEVQNGEFKNWQLIKPDPKHDDIMNALREIFKLLKEGRSE